VKSNIPSSLPAATRPANSASTRLRVSSSQLVPPLSSCSISRTNPLGLGNIFTWVSSRIPVQTSPHIDDKLSWKSHVDYLVTRLSSLWFVMRTIKPIMSLESLRMIYYAYMHSIMTYGIIFGGNSYYTVKLFRIQKNGIRIMTGLKKRDSCIYSLMLHTVNNIHLFTRNIEVHNIDTRQNINLFLPSTSFTKVQKGSSLFRYKDL
jgi:hypothetical protein